MKKKLMLIFILTFINIFVFSNLALAWTITPISDGVYAPYVYTTYKNQTLSSPTGWTNDTSGNFSVYFLTEIYIDGYLLAGDSARLKYSYYDGDGTPSYNYISVLPGNWYTIPIESKCKFVTVDLTTSGATGERLIYISIAREGDTGREFHFPLPDGVATSPNMGSGGTGSLQMPTIPDYLFPPTAPAIPPATGRTPYPSAPSYDPNLNYTPPVSDGLPIEVEKPSYPIPPDEVEPDAPPDMPTIPLWPREDIIPREDLPIKEGVPIKDSTPIKDTAPIKEIVPSREIIDREAPPEKEYYEKEPVPSREPVLRDPVLTREPVLIRDPVNP